MCSHQRRSSFIELAIVCVVIMFFLHEPVAASWKERLLSEAPPKWMALEEYYSKVEASYRKIFDIPPEGKPFPLSFQGTIYYDVRENGGMMVCTDHHVGKDGKGKQRDTTKVRGVNSRYAFNLGKSAPDADTFVLANFQAVDDQARQKVRGSGGDDYNLAFKVQGVRLIDLIKDPLFTIDARGVQRNGKELVQLEYDRKLVKRDRNDPSQTMAAGTEHGIVLLDPEHSWCIREYHLNNPDWKIDGTLEYGDEVDGFPILRRCKHTAMNKQGLGTMLITYEFDKLIHRDIPESEFTLSAFGLPEVQVPGEQKPRTLWRWLLGIGIVLGMLAILLRIYVKKKRQQVSQRI
jgi:hypothetical protein